MGVARGMIPWFGAFKLLLEGQASMVPTQSWQLMALTVAAVLLGGLGVHLALRRSAEAEEDEGEPAPWAQRVRGLFHRGDADEEEDGAGARKDPRAAPPASGQGDPLERRAPPTGPPSERPSPSDGAPGELAQVLRQRFPLRIAVRPASRGSNAGRARPTRAAGTHRTDLAADLGPPGCRRAGAS